MGKVVVGTFVTVDGVMQAPGGPDEDREGGFEHGGWLVPYFDEAMGELIDRWTSAGETLLLGRKTYEIFAAYWPRVPTEDNLISAKLNAMPKYVASRTLEEVEWENSTLLRGEVEGEVAGLKERVGGEIQVTGSGNLIQTLLAADLVDELRLWVFPILLGTGKRLFAGGTIPRGLRLTDTKTFATGVAVHTYERAGELEYGSFALEDGAG